MIDFANLLKVFSLSELTNNLLKCVKTTLRPGIEIDIIKHAFKHFFIKLCFKLYSPCLMKADSNSNNYDNFFIPIE